MNYFKWHYFEVWPKIILLWRNLILFPFYYFCIPLHLKTLFAPWHRQHTAKKIGFHLDDVLGVVFFNVFARIISAIMKIITICYGLLFMVILTVIGLIPVIVWPLIPLLTLLFYLDRKLSPDKKIEYLLEITQGDIPKLLRIIFRQKMGRFVSSHLRLNINVILANEERVHPGSQPDSGQARMTKNQIQHSNGQFTMPVFYKYLAENYKPFADFLSQNGLKSEDVYQTALWYERTYEKQDPPLIFDLTRIKNLQGIGHNWTYGYTVELDKFSADLTHKIPAFPVLLHRDNELNSLQRILLKTEGNNPIIVGEPGVARHLLAEILGYRIISGYTYPSLAHKRILSLNMPAIVSAKPTILEVKGLIEELLEEANQAGNVILCIDEIDKYLSEGNGRVDLSDVIAKFAESSIGLIGITMPEAYHKFIKTNSILSPLFEKVDILPLDSAKTIDVLEFSISPVLEKKYHLSITYPAILKTVQDADRYISSDPFPSKAIELLDEACVNIVTVKKKYILEAPDIDEFLSEKMQMPLGDLQKQEAEKLSHLENLLHEKIINQEEAVRVIASSLRRARLSVGNPNKPIGSFLFLGPTGVGKTETAKALASVYFGSEDKLARFDMSQYQKGEGLERLIGSSTQGTSGELTSKLADLPFSILLLDEFEKSQRDIYNLFLTLLDEGYITDSNGKKVSAKNNIIIATSNAGAEFIREKINAGINKEDLQKELIEYVQTEKIFSPELLNRFDAVVVFTPLSEGHLREVARLMLADLNNRLKPKEISVDINPDLVRKIAALGFDPQFGARAMRRAITEKIEDQVAQKILSGSVQKGEQIKIQL